MLRQRPARTLYDITGITRPPLVMCPDPVMASLVASSPPQATGHPTAGEPAPAVVGRHAA